MSVSFGAGSELDISSNGTSVNKTNTRLSSVPPTFLSNSLSQHFSQGLVSSSLTGTGLKASNMMISIISILLASTESSYTVSHG